MARYLEDFMKHFAIMILSLLFFIIACGKKEIKPVSDTEKPLFETVLDENDKIVKGLLTTEDISPDVKNLIAAIEALQAAKGGLEEAALEMKKNLEAVDSKNANISFGAYSKFSETLASTMKTAGLQSGRNRFYCPMVKKTWVFAGGKIQNPYAPDMRDCGDMMP